MAKACNGEEKKKQKKDGGRGRSKSGWVQQGDGRRGTAGQQVSSGQHKSPKKLKAAGGMSKRGKK